MVRVRLDMENAYPDHQNWLGADGEPEQPPPAGESAPPNPLSDWITLWQSELSALATDREAQETALAVIRLWASAAQAMAALTQSGVPAGRPSHERGGARTAEPARAAPAAAASASGDDPEHDGNAVDDAKHDGELERLRARLAELESRIAELERPAPRPRGRGRRPA